MGLKLGPSAFLEALGDTPDEVAENLKLMGVKGKRGSCRDCPIAVAVNTLARGWGGIRVGKTGELTYSDVQILDPKTTPAVKEFVQRFDRGDYPELDVSRETGGADGNLAHLARALRADPPAGPEEE